MELLKLLTHQAVHAGTPWLLFAVAFYFSYTALKAATVSLLFNDLKKCYTEEMIKNTTDLYNQFDFDETKQS